MPFLPGGPSGPSQRHSHTSAGPACKAQEVDAFREAIRDTFLGVNKPPVRSDEVRGKQFPSTDDGPPCYDKKQVAAFLDAAGIRLAAMESTDRPEEPLVSGAILTGWAEWADSTRFSTTAVCGRAMTQRRSTPSGKSFATRFSGSGHPL